MKSRAFGDIWNPQRSAHRQLYGKHVWHVDLRKAKRLTNVFERIEKEKEVQQIGH